jgi:hypothetical protein
VKKADSKAIEVIGVIKIGLRVMAIVMNDDSTRRELRILMILSKLVAPGDKDLSWQFSKKSV